MRSGIQKVSVGFTGTQKGMTSLQRRGVAQLLSTLKPSAFHHGDCEGADEEAHVLADAEMIPIIIHPPTNSTKRAFCHEHDNVSSVEVLEEFGYLVRNRHIVDDSDVLIATPRTMFEEQRSGTWATIRYARKCRKIVYIIWPKKAVNAS